jgi:hypothetical protein
LQEGSRLSTTFHRTFTLVRPAVASVLEVIGDMGPDGAENSLSDLLEARTSLGTIYIEAMPRYAYGAGLVDGLSTKRKDLTKFGELVRSRDPYLNDLATQWLMHYHLSAPHGPGPTFWNHLVSNYLRVGDELEKGEVAKEIAQHLERVTGKSQTAKSFQSSATVFLGTYAKQDGLGSLGLMEAANGAASGLYEVSEPDPPPPWPLAYALAEYWQGRWGGQKTVNLAELSEPGSFASIFLIGSAQLERLLEELRREGVLDLYRNVPPYQVARLWSDKDELLERLYD